MSTPTSTILPTMLALSVAITATLITIGLCVLYLRRVRIERPAIGTFNGTRNVVMATADFAA